MWLQQWKAVSVSLAVTLCLLVAIGKSTTVSPSSLPRFTLDFDEDPSTRYNQVFTHYRRQLIEMENDLMHSIAPTYRELFMNNTEQIRQVNPEAYYAMEALANITNLPLWQTLLVNAVVDITSFCTSVVAAMTDGTIIHGRNLDFDFPTVLQPLVHRVYIKYQGVIVGEAACIAGYVGFYTAMRYDAFSISYNVRMYPHTNMSEITPNILREWEPGVVPAAQAIEAVVLHNDSYKDAKTSLQQQAVNTPCYLILAGVGHNHNEPNQGIVITRDPYSVNHTQTLDLASDVWYLAQGNLDWWSTNDTRYESTVNYLEALGRANINMQTLVTDVLNQTNVVQWITIFTASMSAEQKVLDVYLTPL